MVSQSLVTRCVRAWRFVSTLVRFRRTGDSQGEMMLILMRVLLAFRSSASDHASPAGSPASGQRPS
jgi:hypothetical protein